MRYVATFVVEGIRGLVRLDVAPSPRGWSARHQITNGAGELVSHWTELGPDTHGVGPGTLAVIDLIRDLNFAEISGGFFVAHQGSFAQEDLDAVLAEVPPQYAVRALTTSSAIN